MSDLDKDIKRLEGKVKKCKTCASYYCNQCEISYTEIKSIENVLLELQKYERLAEANLKEAEDFKQNMCEHRCLIKSDYEKVKEELETYKKIAEKPTIEFAKELNKASLVMLDGRFIGGERERVLRFYKPEDIGVDIKVNEVGKDVQLNEKIFHSGKHILELKFYHNESINALIHRLENLKTL